MSLKAERWRKLGIDHQHARWREAEPGYAAASFGGQHIKLGFLRHALMISRLHFMLEMASTNSGGQVELFGRRQGAELRGNKVNVPDMRSYRRGGSND
jgi:hypothetical protein